MHIRLPAIWFTCILDDMHFRFPRPHMHVPALLPIDQADQNASRIRIIGSSFLEDNTSQSP